LNAARKVVLPFDGVFYEENFIISQQFAHLLLIAASYQFNMLVTALYQRTAVIKHSLYETN
jgi:hypothetical protein